MDAPPALELPAEITSVEDVIRFFLYLFIVDRVHTHPDDQFEARKGRSRKGYTEEQAAERNRLMAEAKKFLNPQNKQDWSTRVLPDIYGLHIWVGAWVGAAERELLDDAPTPVIQMLLQMYPPGQLLEIYVIRRDEYRPRRRTWYWADGIWLFDADAATVYHDRSAAETMAQAVAHQGKLKYNPHRKQDWSTRPEEKPGSQPGVSVQQID